MTFFWAPGCSSWFLGILSAEVDDAQDGSWRRCFVMLFYLAAMPAHMGVDVDGLAWPLHRPMGRDRQMRRQGPMSGGVLSHHCSRAVTPFQEM
jgi:hypothetical protein